MLAAQVKKSDIQHLQKSKHNSLVLSHIERYLQKKYPFLALPFTSIEGGKYDRDCVRAVFNENHPLRNI